jgi:hypothetical protein
MQCLQYLYKIQFRFILHIQTQEYECQNSESLPLLLLSHIIFYTNETNLRT